MKPCLDCGRDAEGTRCPSCQRAYDRNRRASGGRRYGRRYQRNRAAVLAGNPTCVRCGRAIATTADHRVARTRGGTDDRSNLQPMCSTCNSAKGNR